MDQREFVKQWWRKRASRDNFIWSGMTKLNCDLISSLVNEESKILDLGAGDCEISRFLSKRGHSVTAVDYVLEHIKGLPPEIRGIGSDLKDFFINEFFDVILLFGVMTYVVGDEEAKDLYSRCSEMLGPGGVLLIKHQSSLTGSDKLVDNYSKELDSRYVGVYRTIDRDVSMLRECGLDVKVTDPYPSGWNKWPDTAFKLFEAKK